ncbi:MurR/RpiR family transcriptional regulator [Cupriavidus necator]|uniref:MurR/RpiR family transcriptional regulator n=1 Tax=Cupriavidus necator TaxID=106590 RepID=UPI00277F4549|nr:MurR/RpiR family transcriptional regulator [Cupriavidus necator]MDQ0142753.1 DNA-binding MurR/RpiR family transcriptional regulator [Cupriavidus necator]
MQANRKSFVGRIREQLDRLSPSERRLAEFALDFPGDLAGYTASELAGLANVSNATVTRFVRRMGYASYDDARKHVRAEKSAGSPLLLAGSEGADGSAETGSLGAHLQQGLANLAATYRRLSEAQLREIAGAILCARKVWIVGFRSSHPLAMYLRWQLLQIVPGAQAVPGAGETMGEHLAAMTEDDVVIVLALRRRVRELPSVVAQAAKACSRLLYITEQGAPARVPAKWVLRCDVQAPGVLDNHAAVVALCHLLVTQVLELAGTPGRRHLGLVEAFHDALDEL